jgi:hypothetical protein
MATTQTITILKNSDTTLHITVTQESDGSLVDLTGAKMFFSVASTEGDALVIEKKNLAASGADSEILIDPDQVTNKGEADIFLVQSDTSALSCGKYRYDVWVELSSGAAVPVIDPSDFDLNEPVTTVP